MWHFQETLLGYVCRRFLRSLFCIGCTIIPVKTKVRQLDRRILTQIFLRLCFRLFPGIRLRLISGQAKVRQLDGRILTQIFLRLCFRLFFRLSRTFRSGKLQIRKINRSIFLQQLIQIFCQLCL